MTKFIFYDTETTGKDHRDFIQVIQIASILSDTNFNQIENLDLSCRPLPWTLVTTGALLTNKKYDVFDNDVTHYEMTKNWYSAWKRWTNDEDCTFVSYNGLLFDEEIIRRQFYWNLFNPYITNTEGNSRLDLMPKMYVIGTFYKDRFSIPLVKEKPSYRLELLAKSLGLDAHNAHDALADCVFLMELQKKISNIAPNFYQEMIKSCPKENHLNLLTSEKIHLSVTRYGNYFPYTALFSPNYKSPKLPIFNLNFDPKDYVHLSLSELEQVIFRKKDSPVRWIKLGSTQPSIGLNSLLNDGCNLNLDDEYQKRSDFLTNYPDFIDKLYHIEVAKEQPIYDDSTYEQQIYSGGFPSKATYDAFNKFHNAQTMQEKLNTLNIFPETRYKDFAKRICAQLHPDNIPREFLEYCTELVRERFSADGPWPNAAHELDEAKMKITSTKDNLQLKAIDRVICDIIEKS